MNLKFRMKKEDFLTWLRINYKLKKTSWHIFVFRIKRYILSLRVLIIDFKIKNIKIRKERLKNKMIIKEVKEIMKNINNMKEDGYK